MINATPESDTRLRDRLEGLASQDKDFWSFRGNSSREHGHAFFQYPAMMVPQMVETVLDAVCYVHPEVECVGDPFAGSGTVLTESILRGLDFVGNDINPLAVLLCRTKSGPFFHEALCNKVEDLHSRVKEDRSSRVDVNFPGRDKWFRKEVQVALSRIRRGILKEPAAWARRFFWVVLAETTRLSSNSRTSTFKLHIRPHDEIVDRTVDPISVFKRVMDRNVKNHEAQVKYLKSRDYIRSGHYRNSVSISLGDTCRVWKDLDILCDLIITSPPYGDNASTVPYGQYSYLPLQWTFLPDIAPSDDSDYLRSTHEIDSRSIGGSKRLGKTDQSALCERSSSLRDYLSALGDQPGDCTKRVVAFFRDLDACLGPILQRLRPGGVMVWVLGNRKVGGRRVPLDGILSELLDNHNASLSMALSRHIPSKRMAIKNNIADTMSNETILVMRKASQHAK